MDGQWPELETYKFLEVIPFYHHDYPAKPLPSEFGIPDLDAFHIPF